MLSIFTEVAFIINLGKGAMIKLGSYGRIDGDRCVKVIVVGSCSEALDTWDRVDGWGEGHGGWDEEEGGETDHG
jgi:hypothetical protein